MKAIMCERKSNSRTALRAAADGGASEARILDFDFSLTRRSAMQFNAKQTSSVSCSPYAFRASSPAAWRRVTAVIASEAKQSRS